MSNTTSNHVSPVTLAGTLNHAPFFTGTVGYTGKALPVLSDSSMYTTPSLATAADGTLYATFSEGGIVRVLSYADEVWTPLNSGVSSSSGNETVAISPDGVPYLACTDDSDGGVVVKKYVDGMWQNVSYISDARAGGLGPLGLSFDQTGSPYLTFRDEDTDSVQVVRYANGAWSLLGMDTLPLSGNARDEYELTIAADGTPYLVFADGEQNGKATVMRFENDAWVSVGTPGFSLGAVNDVQLAVDGAGMPYVSFRDAAAVSVQRFDGTTWVSMLPPETSDLRIVDLFTAEDGNVYLGTAVATSPGNQVTVLRLGETITNVAALESNGAAGMAVHDGVVYVSVVDDETGDLMVHRFDETLIATASTRGTAITGLTAVDPDNDTLIYEVVGGADEALFTVDGGQVSFINAPAAGTYTVQISVSDGQQTVTQNVSVTVSAPPPNLPPVLDTSASPVLPTSGVNLLPSGTAGSTVAELLGTAATDGDSGSLGIAITGVATGGKLYYSLNGGTNWQLLGGTVSAKSALLLGPDARVYFTASDAQETPIGNALSFKAWDLSEGDSGDKGVNTTSGSYLAGDAVLGALGGSRRASDVVVDDHYAYVADGSAGLKVVDISNPAAPSVVSTFPTSYSAVDVQVQGHYAYVADSLKSFGFSIVDITDPSAPLLAGKAATQLHPAYLAVSGNHVYLTGNDGLLQIFDVTTPSAPVSVAFLPTTDGNAYGASSLAVAGNYVYLGGKTGLTVVDVTTPGAAVIVDTSASIGGQVLDILIEDGIAYVASLQGLSVVDLADPAHPVVLTTWAGNGLSIAWDLAKDGDKLYVAADIGGVIVLDVSVPNTPSYLLTYDAQKVKNVALHDGILYTAPEGTSKLAAYGLNEATAFSQATDTVAATVAPLHPVLTLDAGTQSFIENGDAVLVSPGLTLTDINSSKLGGVAVFLESNTSIVIGGSPVRDVTDEESLVFTASAETGDIAGTYDAEDGLMLTSASGEATLAQWQAALRAVAYLNTSDAPVANRTVHFIAIDADGDGIGEATRQVTITAVNDAPTITGVPEAVQRVTVGAETALAISVADPDSTTLTLTVIATHGTVSGLVDINPDTAGIQLIGTAAQINEALAQARFKMDAAGAGSVTLMLSDGSDELPTVATYQFNASVPVVPPTTPPVVSTPVDGVPVQIGTGNDGQQQIVVPVVTPNRNEDASTPNGKLADIAVVKNAAGASLLNLGLPVGTGLTTNGPATTVSGTNAQSVLDGRITSASGSAEQKASAQAFLNSLPSDTQVVVQTVTVTAQSNNGGPLVISAANTQDGHKTAVVVDTRSLPAGTLIDLENIDFAVIVGDARVTGGAGANVAYGDDDSQFIVLGEGDDVLHGGGGNDTVGSLRGNDQVFGDAGNDVVYGGSGNDTLNGGAGNDAMNGGFGFDTGVQSGARADYTVRTENGSVILTHRTSGEVDRFTDVERITFDSGKALVIAHEAGDVANLRAQYANDDLIELNLTRAIIGAEGNDVITPELGVGRNIDLGAGQDVVKLTGGRDGVHLDVEAGQIVDLTRLEDGAMLSLKNVELLEFANGDVTVLAHTNDQAILGRAYELLLGRNVDVEGFQFWAEALNAGVSLQSVLQSIVTSQEAATMYKLANGNFIEQLYVQGLDRASDAAGKGYWADALAAGVSRATVLEGFAGSAEAVEVIGSTIDVNTVS